MLRAVVAALAAMALGAAAAHAQTPPPRPSDADLQRIGALRSEALRDADQCEALAEPVDSAPPCDAFFRALPPYAALMMPVFDWCEHQIRRIAAHDPTVRLEGYCVTLNQDPLLERQRRIAARMRGP
jgi:hypothetical protein